MGCRGFKLLHFNEYERTNSSHSHLPLPRAEYYCDVEVAQEYIGDNSPQCVLRVDGCWLGNCAGMVGTGEPKEGKIIMWSGFWRVMFLIWIVASAVAGFSGNPQAQLFLYSAAVLFYLFVIESKIAMLEKRKMSVEIKIDQQVFSQLFTNAILKVGEAVKTFVVENGKAKKTTTRGKN